MNRYRHFFMGLALLGLPLAANAQQTFSDGTFNNADWIFSFYTRDGGGTQTVTQQLSGGNPGAFEEIVDTVYSAPGSLIDGVHLRVGAVYTPSIQGAISSIDYSEDAIMFSGFGQGQADLPILMQNGNLYTTATYSTTAFANWTTISRPNLLSSSFGLVDTSNLTVNMTQNPDFSTNGSAIQFGFARSNETIGGSYTIDGGIDNWKVQVNSVSAIPEASSVVMMLLGLGIPGMGFVLRKRRKSSVVIHISGV